MSHPYDGCEEVYEIVKAIIVVQKNWSYKIEVTQDMKVQDKNSFRIRVYREASCKATPSFVDDLFSKEIKPWSHISDFPSVQSDTTDDAIAQAIRFLRERWKK